LGPGQIAVDDACRIAEGMTGDRGDLGSGAAGFSEPRDAVDACRA